MVYLFLITGVRQCLFAWSAHDARHDLGMCPVVPVLTFQRGSDSHVVSMMYTWGFVLSM